MKKFLIIVATLIALSLSGCTGTDDNGVSISKGLFVNSTDISIEIYS